MRVALRVREFVWLRWWSRDENGWRSWARITCGNQVDDGESSDWFEGGWLPVAVITGITRVYGYFARTFG